MDNAVSMGIVQGIEDVLDDPDSVFDIETIVWPAIEQCRKRDSFDQLHHNTGVSLGLENLRNRNNIRMMQLLVAADLVLHSNPKLRVDDQIVRHSLDRYEFVALFIPGAPHNTHSPTTKALLDDVMFDVCSRMQAH